MILFKKNVQEVQNSHDCCVAVGRDSLRTDNRHSPGSSSPVNIEPSTVQLRAILTFMSKHCCSFWCDAHKCVDRIQIHVPSCISMQSVNPDQLKNSVDNKKKLDHTIEK